MKFVDIAHIHVKAGDGGAGMSHFRREKFEPFGGPDGGNGGRGGDVYVEATEGLTTLLDFRYLRHHEAQAGGKGGTNQRYGKSGEDCVLKVPCGTVVMDVDSSEVIGEVLNSGDKLLVAQGGKGGIGNKVFTTSRNQSPTRTIPPEPGQRRTLALELKMIADVGIIGAPNAGKSTLISVISAARPKVADYPFTTLVPNLGVVSYKDVSPFVVADVPGLISGASEGKGLGFEFLRHIERTRLLVHLVDGSQESADLMIADYETILQELKTYDEELLQRPRITVLSKLDVLSSDDGYGDSVRKDQQDHELVEIKKYFQRKNVHCIEISAATRSGIDALLDAIVNELNQINSGKNL